MTGRQIILVVLLVSAGVLLQGCAAAVVGVGAAGTVAYVRGDLQTQVPKNLDTVYVATKAAAKQLGLWVKEDRKDEISAQLVAYDAVDTRVSIKLSRMSDSITKLSIRVGFFGNQEKSQVIYQKVLDNLGEQ